MDRYMAVSALAALLIGCGGGGAAGGAGFSVDPEVNGEKANGVDFSIFGAGSFTTSDGNDVSVVLLIASDNRDLCAEIGADFTAFQLNLQGGLIPGKFVTMFLTSPGGLPKEGDSIQGDGRDVVVQTQFLAADGEKLTARATGDGDALLDVSAFGEADVFSGDITARLTDDAGGVVQLSGGFKNAAPCQPISDFANLNQ
jgi:hypothetical protein